MKTLSLLLAALLVVITAKTQNLQIKLNAGNHTEIVCSFFDDDNNQLICLDREGFIVIWDLNNYTIINKFQIAPSNIYLSSKVSAFQNPEIRASKRNIAITYPQFSNPITPQEELVDVYDRETGKFKTQSKINQISRYTFPKQGGILGGIATLSEYNKFFYLKNAYIVQATDSGTIAASEKLNEIFTCLLVNKEETKLAIGYEKGKIEVRDTKKLQIIFTANDYASEKYGKKINHIAFIPQTNLLAFTAFGSNKIFIRDFTNKEYIDSITVGTSNSSCMYKLAISPTGNYMAIYRKSVKEIYVYDFKTKLLKNVDNNFNVGQLGDVHFKTDDILLATGISYRNENISGTTQAGKSGAFIGLIDWKQDVVSTNFNISPVLDWLNKYGSVIEKPSSSETVLFNKFGGYAYIKPDELIANAKSANQRNIINDFVDFRNNTYKDSLAYFGIEFFSRTYGNMVLNANNKLMATYLFHKSVGFDSDNDTFYLGNYHLKDEKFINSDIIKIDYKAMKYANNYVLVNALSNKGLYFFTNIYKREDGKKGEKIIVINKKGQKVWEDEFYDGYSADKNFSISTDGKYLCYQQNEQDLMVVSLTNFKIIKSINTGFSKSGYYATGFSYPEFAKNNSSQLIHQVYKTKNSNLVFCLLKTDFIKNTADTLLNLDLTPITYCVDSTASKVALSYNYNFNDTTLWNENKIPSLAIENFKSAFSPTIVLYNIETKQFEKNISIGNIGVQTLDYIGSQITCLQNDGKLLYINTDNVQQRMYHVFDENNQQAIIADSIYYATKNMVQYIQLQKNNSKTYSTQADILLNQPHAIIKNINSQADSTIKPFALAYNKRVEQQNITQSTIDSLFSSTTTVALKAENQAYVHTQKNTAKIPVNIVGNSKEIKSIAISINGYPITKRKGLDAATFIKNKNFEVELNEGENFITITAQKTNGIQLPSLKYYYNYSPQKMAPSKLWFFAAGVSEYADTSYNLKFAAKDAKDIAQAMQYKVFDTSIFRVITNKQVTKQNILQWQKDLESTSPNDVVILYFAGHGLLDKQYNFHYATYNIDFAEPQKNGLSYDAILDLLESSSSRKKILLLDACHSGAFDRSIAKKDFNAKLNNTASATITNNEVARSTLKPSKTNTNIGERQAFILMNELFNDFSNEVGAEVIAASLGNSYALETPQLKNGIFTYSLIRAMGLLMADETAKNKSISEIVKGNSATLPNIKEFVAKEVKKITNGAQIPSIRSNTVFSENIIFYNKTFNLNYDDAYFQFLDFLEKYK